MWLLGVRYKMYNKSVPLGIRWNGVVYERTCRYNPWPNVQLGWQSTSVHQCWLHLQSMDTPIDTQWSCWGGGQWKTMSHQSYTPSHLCLPSHHITKHTQVIYIYIQYIYIYIQYIQ